jgi:SAM-dependent methyltransferase
MLDSAEDHVSANKLTNVDLLQGDITRLHAIPSASADGVISTLSLHHLPAIDHLEACFREFARILRHGGAVYLADFGRLKSLKSVLYFAYMNAKSQQHIFSLDYERSLRAAFGAQDLAELAKRMLPSSVRVCSTFLAPLLVIAQTPSLPLSAELNGRLASMRERLPRRYRADLDMLRRFFRLGGMPNDTFC